MLQREHSTILSTSIKLASVIKIFVLSVFEWPLKTGFTVLCKIMKDTFCLNVFLCFAGPSIKLDSDNKSVR